MRAISVKGWLIFFLLLFNGVIASEKKTVCLNMVVRNSSHFVKNCLHSVKPFIDYWVIVDAGSPNWTKKFVQGLLKDIPGEYHEVSWKGFEETYNEAFQLCKGKADYVLFMSSDDWLEYEPSFQLPHLSQDVYCIGCVNWQKKEEKALRRKLIKASLPWRWKNDLGEYLSCDKPCTSSVLEGILCVKGLDFPQIGASWEQNIDMLTRILTKDPENARAVLYLAESYRKGGKYEQAFEMYNKRILMGQEEQEVFWAMFRLATLQRELSYPVDTVIDSLIRAHRYRPYRIEPVYELAHLYNQQGRYQLAYECITSRALMPKPAEEDILGLIKWQEEYGLLFEFSLCSFYVGHYQESLDACDALLKIPSLPKALQERVRVNRKFPIRELEKRRKQEEGK